MTATQQPSSPHLRATLILAALAQFMVILDVSVVNVALPAIHHALHFSESGLQWVVNAYTITFAGFLMLGGRAADLLGRRRVFVWGLVLFAVTSLGGGFSNDRTVLVVMRLLQGLGGAVIAPASLSILTTTFTEPHERNRAVGIWGAMGGAGGAAGVLAGGILTDLLSWRWILFVNVPIGLTAALLSQRLLLEGRNPKATRNFDLTGALSSTGGLSLLVYGIVRTDTSGWGNAQTLGLIAAGIGLLIVFIAVEGWFAKAPLMPLRLFASRQLSAANLVVLLVGASIFGMWFFFTLYLQEGRGYSPIHAGLIFLPMTLVIVVVSPLASKLSLRFGPRPVLIAGMASLAAGLFLFARLSLHGSYLGEMLAPSLLSSLGLPLAFVTGTICATTGVAPQEAGLASGIVNTARLFGGALGLAVLAALAASRTTSDLRHPTFAVHTFDQALVAGFQRSFVIGGAIALAGVLVAAFGMPRVVRRPVTQAHPTETPAAVALDG